MVNAPHGNWSCGRSGRDTWPSISTDVTLRRVKSFWADSSLLSFCLLRKKQKQTPCLAAWLQTKVASILSGDSVLLSPRLFLVPVGECHCRRRLTFHTLGTLTCCFSGCELNLFFMPQEERTMIINN